MWNLHKNLKKAEKATLIRKVRQTRRADQLLFKGRPVQMHRLLRYCKENKIPLQILDTATPRNRQQRLQSPHDASSRASSAALELQSLFRSPSQPSQPVVMYGDMRTSEVIIWNTESYLNSYFTTGLGTRYFKVEVNPTVTPREEVPGQSLLLVRNEGAWDGVVEPVKMYNHIFDAICALKGGFIEPAFEAIDKAYCLVQILFEQEAPTLLPFLIYIFFYQVKGDTNFARNVRQFILDMAKTVIGHAHPLSRILTSLCTVASTNCKFFVWRIVCDALRKVFAALEDSEALTYVRLLYVYALRNSGFAKEGEHYLDLLYGNVEEHNPEYIAQKAAFSKKQGKYMEAEIQYRKCLELLKEAESEILANGTHSSSFEWSFELNTCRRGLADVLELTGRIDESKAIRWRNLQLVSATWGPDSVDIQIAGSCFDEFLTANGYIEESTALRAQYPSILQQNKLPPESL
jgi:tetratricopeptide (TPR) repeat protein